MGDGRADDRGVELRALEEVRCLDCGAVYAKPAGQGTVMSNPGCPDCGYVGWLAAAVPVKWRSPRLRSGEGHQHRRLASEG